MTPLLEFMIVAAVALGGFLFARRYGGGAALEHLERANTILKNTVEDQAGQIDKLKDRVAELEARTDLTIAIIPVLAAVQKHDEEMVSRWNTTLLLLEQISSRLATQTAAV